MRTPVCSICGGNHYKSFCWRNPKRGKNLRAKYKKAYATGKTPKHDKILSAQPLDRKRLILELDRYFSLIVRIRGSDKYGVATCVTCGKKLPFRAMDCGHYRSRQHLQTRWDLTNGQIECTVCNRVLRGNLKLYREYLVRTYGEEKVRELETRPPRKITTPELQELLETLKTQYKQLIASKQAEK